MNAKKTGEIVARLGYEKTKNEIELYLHANDCGHMIDQVQVALKNVWDDCETICNHSLLLLVSVLSMMKDIHIDYFK